MLRSVAVPGWGQWANGKRIKAGLVAGSEGYLLYRAVDWARVERQSTGADQENAGAHRRDFTWWTVLVGALSMGDAYIDAQLGEFDVEFTPQDRSGEPTMKSLSSWPEPSPGPVIRLALRLRLP
jgi:hypothetical protein